MSGREEADEEQEGPEEDGSMMSVSVILRVANSILNLDLLRSAAESNEDISWRTLSFSSLYIGVIGLMLWITYVVVVVSADYVVSSGGLLTIGSRALSIGPLTPVAVFLGLSAVSWFFGKLESQVWSNEVESRSSGRDWKLLGVSVVALLAAFVMRGGIYHAASVILGSDVYQLPLVGIMLADVGYLSLLLVGIGSFGGLYFTSG